MMTEKSPFHWDKMKDMNADCLREEFEKCADLSIVWAIDQAQCLSYHVATNSEQANVLKEFCGVAADKALQEGELSAALTAFHLAANGQEDSEANITKLTDVLKLNLQTDKKKMMGSAMIFLSRTQKGSKLYHALAAFLIEHEDCNDPVVLLRMVRDDSLGHEQVDLLVKKIQEVVDQNLGAAKQLVWMIMNNGLSFSPEQESSLRAVERMVPDVVVVTGDGHMDALTGEDPARTKNRIKISKQHTIH